MSARAIALCAACIDDHERIAHGTPLTPAAQRAMEQQRQRLQSLYLLLCEETAEPVQLDAAAVARCICSPLSDGAGCPVHAK